MEPAASAEHITYRQPITPAINHRIIAALMGNAQLHTVRGSGHLMLIDSPARVAPVITSFLNGDQPEPAATSSRVPLHHEHLVG